MKSKKDSRWTHAPPADAHDTDMDDDEKLGESESDRQLYELVMYDEPAPIDEPPRFLMEVHEVRLLDRVSELGSPVKVLAGYANDELGGRISTLVFREENLLTLTDTGVGLISIGRCHPPRFFIVWVDEPRFLPNYGQCRLRLTHLVLAKKVEVAGIPGNEAEPTTGTRTRHSD